LRAEGDYKDDSRERPNVIDDLWSEIETVDAQGIASAKSSKTH